MKQLPSNDPFEDTKMSFGEHLEELRVALWKSVIALALGFLVGLFVGGDVVGYVQTPLFNALEDLRLKQTEEKIEAEGSAPEWAAEGRFVPERYYLETERLVDLLKELGVRVEEPEASLPDRTPITLWRSVEDDPRVRTIGTGVPDAFTVYVKASLVVGVVLASPFVFYFIWEFVAAGLYAHEKRYIHVFMPMSIGLFLLGAAVAFFLAIRFVLAFLFQFYDWMDIDPTPRISEWLGFVLILPIGFGVAFQMPLVMLFLERIGVMSVASYLRYWRYAVLVIAFLSMILTPADPWSMILMAAPLIVLYFGGVLMCKYWPKKKAD